MEKLYKKAKLIDEEAMKKISLNDKKRICRVLEIYHSTGKTKTELEKDSRKKGPDFDYVIFGIDMDRDKLYDRINKRVDIMMRSGLINEVKELINKYKDLPTSIQGLGYKEVVEYLKGAITEEEMVEKIKMETRRYAKRQLTWFRKYGNIIWLNGLNNVQNNIGIILEEYGEKKN